MFTAFEVREFVLVILCIIIGCPVQLIREVFSEIAFVSTHICLALRRWNTFASLWRANLRGDSSVLGVHFSNVFWGLLIVFVTRTHLNSFLKVYYRCVFIESSKVVFWKCVLLLVHASMKPGCLARRPLCYKVNLPSWVARRPLCNSKSTAIWSSVAPLYHDLWYFRHRTNEHFSSMLFIRKKLINQPIVAPHWSHWKQHTWPNYWKSYWREHTHSTEGFDDCLETCERCSVSEPLSKHNSLCPSVHHKKCDLGSLISTQVKKTCQ